MSEAWYEAEDCEWDDFDDDVCGCPADEMEWNEELGFYVCLWCGRPQ